VGDDLDHTDPSLAGSAAAWSTHQKGGALPVFDAAAHSRVVDLVRSLVVSGSLGGIHDASSGGLAVALAEMAVRSGVGVDVTGVPDTSHLFAELPSRVVVSVDDDDLEALLARAESAGVPAVVLGRGGGSRFRIATGRDDASPLIDLDLAEVTAAWRDRLPEALGTGTTQA